jgi:hypothetical protein
VIVGDSFRGFLGGDLDHGAHPAGQARHLEEREGEAPRGKIGVIPAVELTTSCDATHLVVKLGPSHAAAVVAETDE